MLSPTREIGFVYGIYTGQQRLTVQAGIRKIKCKSELVYDLCQCLHLHSSSYARHFLAAHVFLYVIKFDIYLASVFLIIVVVDSTL